ncbi:DUF3304 domain-containing protein [Halopseudomonas sp.]|uniref:DUF3304 domain-containing protein n=1 Tax=Halopseudomonas sp. TaxID=2901191 RepID=UPI0030011753
MIFRLAAIALLLPSALLLNACSAQTSPDKLKRLGAPIEGYSHTSDAINRFSVNGIGGPNVGPHQGGGKQNCCVSMPVTWQPGLTVVVEWEEYPNPRAKLPPLGTDTFHKAYTVHAAGYTHHRVEVEVAPYEVLGVVNVHFLPCNEVKVTAGIYGYGHPQYPYVDSLNMEEPSQCLHQ